MDKFYGVILSLVLLVAGIFIVVGLTHINSDTAPSMGQQPLKEDGSVAWHWLQDDVPSASWIKRWNAVCPKTGRMDDIEIWERPNDHRYVLWVRGAGYGEYTSLEYAQERGLYVLKLKDIRCE